MLAVHVLERCSLILTKSDKKLVNRRESTLSKVKEGEVEEESERDFPQMYVVFETERLISKQLSPTLVCI